MRDAVGNLLTDGQLWGHDLRSLGSFRAHLVNRILYPAAGIRRWQLLRVQSRLLAGLRMVSLIRAMARRMDFLREATPGVSTLSPLTNSSP